MGRLVGFSARKALFLVVGVLVALSGMTAVAFGAGGSDVAGGSLSCPNGWVLRYDATGGRATVIGVETVGSGTLAVPASDSAGNSVTELGSYSLSPSKADGAPNAAVADGLLAALKSVELPDSVTALGDHAFFEAANLSSCDVGDKLATLSSQVFAKTGLKSISIPATVEGLNYQDFLGCASLTNVEFEGDTLGYIGRYVFSGCTALKRLEVPMLTSYPPADVANQNSNFRINNGAFYNCTALDELVFLGDTNFSAYKYFESPTVLSGCKDDLKLVYYCGEDSFTGEGKGLRANTYDRYYSIDFYRSKADAERSANRIASVTYPATTKVSDLVAGTANVATAYSAGRSSVPMGSLSGGQVWAFDSTTRAYSATTDQGAPTRSLQSTLSCSMVAYPTNAADLDYAFLTSKEIETLRSSTTNNMFGESLDLSNPDAYYMLPKRGGAAAIDDLSVVAADGTTTVDPSLYTLYYQRRVYDSASRTYSFEDVSAGSVSEEGMYRVIATGALGSESAGTSCLALVYVKQFSLAETMLSSPTAYGTAGKAALEAASFVGSDAYFSVVAPCSSWQLGLVATSLAGVGNTVALFSDNEYAASSDETHALQAIIQAGNLSANGAARDNVFVLGTDEQVSAVYRNRVNQVRGSSDGLTSFKQPTPQALSLAVYDTVRQYGKGGSSARYEYSWGDTAIIASSTKSYAALPIAELAYKAKAPVFFTEANGTLSQDVLTRLSQGGFAKVVIAGDEHYVSGAVAGAVAGAAGVQPVRLLGSSLQASLDARELADYLVSGYGATASSLVLVNPGDPSAVLAACELAALRDGIVFPVASVADSKFVQQYLEKVGDGDMGRVYYVGSVADAGLPARLKAIGTPSALSTDIAMGDTFESDGYVYRLTGAGSAAYVSRSKANDVPVFTPLPVQLNGKSLSATGYSNTAFDLDGVSQVVIDTAFCAASASNLFQGNAKVPSVKITASNSSKFKLGASFFQDCTALKSVVLPATLSSIGANAFSGCAALTSISLPKSVATIGAKAFYGCKKLASMSLSGNALTSLGASAFQGCTALKKLTVASTALKKVGKNAFKGCKKLSTITFKTKKLKSGTVGSGAFSGTAPKATVKVPKAKVSSYGKIFRAKGLSKNAKVKKL